MYIENWVREKADKLIKKEHTTDPDLLLRSEKNVTYDYLPMNENINGLYRYISPKKQILAINDLLEGLDKEYASFHELGHVVLEHKGRLLLNCRTVSDIKEEYEADLFATYMVFRRNGIILENIHEFRLPKRAQELIHKFL